MNAQALGITVAPCQFLDEQHLLARKPDFAGPLLRQAHYGPVRGSCERAIRLNPNNANAYLNRGIAYRSRGEYEQALSDFDRAIELDPNNAEAYTNREKVLTELGRNTEVSTANEQAATISSQPDGDQAREKSQTAEEQLDVINQAESEPIGITIRALADTYSESDLLQFSDYADALVDFITSKETQKPLTIAIDAS